MKAWTSVVMIAAALILGAGLNWAQAPTSEYVPDVNTVGLWHFNEVSGSITLDASASHNDGMVIGATLTTAGRFGNALNFDGVDDAVKIANPFSGIQSHFTIEAWINVRSFTSGPQPKSSTIFRNRAHFNDILVHIPPNPTAVHLDIYEATGQQHQYKGATCLQPGVWYHVAVTYDKQHFRIFVNGDLDLETPASYDVDWSRAYIGTAIGGNPFDVWHSLDGVIDEVRISNIARDFGNAPPVANAGPDQTVECAGPAGTAVTLNGGDSHDPDCDGLTYTWREGSTIIAGPTGSPTSQVTLGLGTHAITLTVDDGKGGTDTDDAVITIQDTTPPKIAMTVSPTALWPPNHKMVLVARGISATDVCDPSPTLSVSVTSNEPVNGLGDGDTAPDWEVKDNGNGTFDVWVRAERGGKGNGRIYTVTATATDHSGNSASNSATVTVGHDQGKKAGKPAIAGVEEVPEAFGVDQNYPNPFNPTTAIRYALPEASDVRLTIYNMLGQQVRVLVQGRQEAGYYRVVWDGKDDSGRAVSSGIYLYRFESRGLVQTQKMLLLK